MKTYEKPVISVDTGLAEGVYAASGATGPVTVKYLGVWDTWSKGGKALCSATWTGISGTITLNITFNDTLDQVEVEGASAQINLSGSTATLTFSGAASDSLTIGIHLDHGTSISDLNMISYSSSVN